MAMLVTDPDIEHRLIEERRACGGNHHDEVWEGVCFMAPLPNNDHQRLVTRLTAVLMEAVPRQAS